jgi:hypothetical protein
MVEFSAGLRRDNSIGERRGDTTMTTKENRQKAEYQKAKEVAERMITRMDDSEFTIVFSVEKKNKMVSGNVVRVVPNQDVTECTSPDVIKIRTVGYLMTHLLEKSFSDLLDVELKDLLELANHIAEEPKECDE